jgi:hypothetical protein
VGRHVERSLNRDLQGMFDETLLADIDAQLGGPGGAAQLGHAGFNDRELLEQEGAVSHRRDLSGSRYRRRMASRSNASFRVWTSK